jgi:hypothetical protein
MVPVRQQTNHRGWGELARRTCGVSVIAVEA